MSWNAKIANLQMTDFTCEWLEEDKMRDTIASVGTIATAVIANPDFQSYRS